jgi:hypothetical protein
MGLLDDAIREHLELKRQHGADPDEVARQEREVLGAARRGEFAAASEGEAGEAAPFDAEEPATGGGVRAETIEREEPADEAEQPEPEPEAAADEVPPPEGREPAPGYDEDPWLEQGPDEVPADESLDRPAGEPGEPGEDVLEETPEFLQETPEHDRLWFEQRPPRDFDWDK